MPSFSPLSKISSPNSASASRNCHAQRNPTTTFFFYPHRVMEQKRPACSKSDGEAFCLYESPPAPAHSPPPLHRGNRRTYNIGVVSTRNNPLSQRLHALARRHGSGPPPPLPDLRTVSARPPPGPAPPPHADVFQQPVQFPAQHHYRPPTDCLLVVHS